MKFTQLTFNTTAKARTRTFQGREYFVAPAVMMVEGVHKGNKGRIRYGRQFLKNEAAAWREFSPITVYHPKKGGKYVSAEDLEVLDNHGVGFHRSTRYDKTADGKPGWKTECWFDKEQTKRVDPRVYNALEKGEVTEVSTGMFLQVDSKKGTWNGQPYDADAKRMRASDHLAVLPDQEGACSVKKGAGLNVNSKVKVRLRGFRAKDRRKDATNLAANEASFSEISDWIRQAMAAKFQQPGYSWNGWVSEVYDSYFIYAVGSGSPDYKYTYFKQSYEVGDGEVTLTGKPVEVERKVSYQKVGVANADHTSREESMAKKVKFDRNAHLTSLVGNEGRFSEEDREWLEALDDDELQAIPVKVKKKVTVNAGPDDDDDDQDDDDDEAVVNAGKKTKKKAKKVVTNVEPDEDDDEEEETVANAGESSPVTLSGLVANASDKEKRKLLKSLGIDPDDLKEVKRAREDDRNKYVTQITANSQEFTKEELDKLDTSVLRKMAKAMVPVRSIEDVDFDGDVGDEPFEGLNFYGRNAAEPTANEGETEDRMLLPPGAEPVVNADDEDEEDDEDEKPRKKRRKLSRR